MSTFVEIKSAIDRQAEAFEEFKKVNDQRLDAVAKGNEARATELAESLGKIETRVNAFTELKRTLEVEMELNRERLEELETRATTPKKSQQEKTKDEYKDAFIGWLRNKGTSPLDEQKIQDLAKKDVTIGSSAGGGFAVPEEIAREIERLEKKFSPVRDLVKVVQTGSSDYKELVNIRGTTAGWVGESDTRSATNTSQLREVAPTFGELYAYPQASEWSLDDIFFNVEAWLAEEAAQEFAIAEATAVISGNGSSRPTGMHNSAPTDVADFGSPFRAAAVYEFVASLNSPSAGINADSLITLIYRLNSRYRANASWIMNSNTTAAVRKLKDSDGNYLWQPGLQLGQPDRLLGYMVSTWEQMPDIDTNALPIGFGDWRRAYVIADRVGLRITRDSVTNVGFIRFYIRRREGGHVLNNDSAKFLKTTTA